MEDDEVAAPHRIENSVDLGAQGGQFLAPRRRIGKVGTRVVRIGSRQLRRDGVQPDCAVVGRQPGVGVVVNVVVAFVPMIGVLFMIVIMLLVAVIVMRIIGMILMTMVRACSPCHAVVVMAVMIVVALIPVGVTPMRMRLEQRAFPERQLRRSIDLKQFRDTGAAGQCFDRTVKPRRQIGAHPENEVGVLQRAGL